MPDGGQTKFFRGWNELKLTGKLPERRSYTTGCLQDGQMYIFGGQDLKEGSVNSTWRINLEKIIKMSEAQADNIDVFWEQIHYDKKGPTPDPISHHNAFIFQGKMHVFGGLSGSESNGHLWILDIKS